MTTLIVGVACFFVGGLCGLLLGGIAAASARADERTREAMERERLARPFHVIKDDDGLEHIVPVEDNPPTG